MTKPFRIRLFEVETIKHLSIALVVSALLGLIYAFCLCLDKLWSFLKRLTIWNVLERMNRRTPDD